MCGSQNRILELSRDSAFNVQRAHQARGDPGRYRRRAHQALSGDLLCTSSRRGARLTSASILHSSRARLRAHFSQRLPVHLSRVQAQ